MAELLPDLPSAGQAEPGGQPVAGQPTPHLIGLLTALGDHHHDPAVAKAARKAAFKARSRAAAAIDWNIHPVQTEPSRPPARTLDTLTIAARIRRFTDE